MAKPTCIKCSSVATIAGMCGRCHRNAQPESVPTPPAGNTSPLNIATSQGRSPLNTCAGPGCDTELPAQAGPGRRRKFCSPTCRDRARA